MQLEAKKSLGQNFLNNPRVPAQMADAASIEKGDVILEVGPGTGVLTRELLQRKARIVAVEADARAITVLKETFEAEIATGALTLHHGDIRTLRLHDIGLKNGQFSVVSNIPYYLSGILFRLFLSGEVKPKTLVFLVQKEVAERITRSEKESLLSLSVKAYGQPSYIKTVKRGNFTPTPAVDSAIIAVRDIKNTLMESTDETFFFELLHLGFGQKRKQLLGNLAAKFDRTVLEEIFDTLTIPRDTRAEDISLKIWLLLTRSLYKTTRST